MTNAELAANTIYAWFFGDAPVLEPSLHVMQNPLERWTGVCWTAPAYTSVSLDSGMKVPPGGIIPQLWSHPQAFESF